MKRNPPAFHLFLMAGRRDPDCFSMGFGGFLKQQSRMKEAVMAKSRPIQNGQVCAVVAQDAAGRWITSGTGRRPCASDSAETAIHRALYGKRRVQAVLLVPPGCID